MTVLFSTCRAWFASDIDVSIINQFELYGGTVALDTTDGTITHYISNNALEPTTQQLLSTTSYYIITTQWIDACIQYQSLQSISKYLLPPVVPSVTQQPIATTPSIPIETLPATVQTTIATTAVITEERIERYAAQRQKRATAKRQHQHTDNDSPNKAKQQKIDPTLPHTVEHSIHTDVYSNEQIIQLNSNIYATARVLKRPTVPLKSLIPFPTPQSSFTVDTNILPADMFAPVTLPTPDYTLFAGSDVMETVHNNNVDTDTTAADQVDDNIEENNDIAADDTVEHSDTDVSESVSSKTRSKQTSARSTPVKSPSRRLTPTKSPTRRRRRKV